MSATLDTTNSAKLGALLRLLDDDTPMVREAISKELLAYGTSIAHFIHEQHVDLDMQQWGLLRGIMFEHYQQQLRRDWPKWLMLESDAARLEAALGLLARFQNGPHYRPPIAESLDALAEAYDAHVDVVGYETLAQFLFTEKHFSSIDEDDDNTEASNLAHVLESRQGLPISLVCIYMLVGHRHGLSISGCNWPGSFYARFMEGGKLYVVDCNTGGVVREADELLRLQGPSRESAEAVLTLNVDATTMIRRILSNLAFAYRRAGNTDSSLLMLDLLRALERMLKRGFPANA